MATTDAQFTHGRLLEAASLLRLPVSVLADSLGLAPDIFTTSSTLHPPPRSADGFQTAMSSPWTLDTRRWVCPDQDQTASPSLTSSNRSLLAYEPSPDRAISEHVSEYVSEFATFPGRMRFTAGTSPKKVSPYCRRSADAVSPMSGMSQAGSAYKLSASSGLAILKLPPSPRLTSSGRRSSDDSTASRDLPSPGQVHDTSGTSPIPEAPAPLPRSRPGAGCKPVAPRGLHSPSGSLASSASFETGREEKPVGPTALFVPQNGPCSKVWKLPPRIRRRKKIKTKPEDGVVPKPKRNAHDVPDSGPRRRGAYTDETMKRNTALTRILKSCIRCRMNRGRCNPDPGDPSGACLTCKRITGPTLCKMPCYRYIITDASLYREQTAPYQMFSRRWQSMDIVDIPATGWASPEIRTIAVSPNHISAPFSFRVREFIPVEGDLLEEQWATPCGKQRVPTPRYAIAEMNETASDMKEYIEKNISNFIAVTVGNLDQLLWETYRMAFRHIGVAKTSEERSLLTNTLRLWVTCRLISNPVHICGEDKLGGQVVYSPDSSHNGRVPMPVIMTAQFECINYTTFLRPWGKAVLKQLNDLVLAKRREYWLSIYYATFVLLHSCAMMTRRDEETARQYDMKTRFANPESIRAHHSGCQTILAHFHFINKGVIPFSLPHTVTGKQELARAANLDDEQVDFVWRTSNLVNDPERAARMRRIREENAVGDDLYWVSMLYDKEWVPQGND